MSRRNIHRSEHVLRELVGPRRARRARAELNDGWLRVHFDGRSPATAHFPLSWLRHHCARDRAKITRGASESARRIGVIAAYVDAERRLHVQWDEQFAHRRELSESVYPLDWLRRHA